MKKDHMRDYATAAFVFYAREGSVQAYIKKLVDQMERQDGGKGTGICKPTEAALMHKEDIMRDKAAEIADLDAVEKVLYILGNFTNGKEIRQSIEFVYFKDAWKDMEKGDIQDRVHHSEIFIPASERQIYRWLKKARMLFSIERGLRM